MTETTDTAPATTADTAPLDAATTQGTTTADVTTPENKATATPADDAFVLPEDHKNKSWASKIKTQDDVYKQLDNLSALVGKKEVLPIDYATATPEQIEKYHATLRPESADAYEFGEGAEPEFKAAVGDLFLKNGISAYQGSQIIKQVTELSAKMVEAQQAANVSADGYLELMGKSFGAQAKQVVAQVEQGYKAFATPEDKAILDGINNNVRVALDRTVFNIMKKFGAEETGKQAETQGIAGSVTDINVVRVKLRDEFDEMMKRPYTASEYQALKEKLAATYKGVK
jgi:hypothetical protein